MYIFCLDVGGTGTRGALFTENGEELARASARGGALSLGVEQSHNAIETVWNAICQQASDSKISRENTTLLAGIAGYGLPGRNADLVQRLNQFGDVYTCSDGYGALLAATDGKPGALISIGTGVIAMRLREDAKTLCISGWGFPAGDLGSGAWLGLQLVGDLTKYCDGVALTPPLQASLVAEIAEITGCETAEIMEWQCNGRPAQFASLAPLIVAGAKSDDPYCINLLARAATELVAIADALWEQQDGVVFLAGGLASTLRPYCNELSPRHDWSLSTGDPLLGLLTIAMNKAPREDQLKRHGASSD